MINRLAIFCGSKEGTNPVYREHAAQLSRILCEHSIEIVYGGGKVGLMGVIADTAMSNGGRVTGIIPEKLKAMEVGHYGITTLEIVDTMHDRKARMAELSDGFIAMPGGIGTLEEIIEVFTWHQIGYHNKPCAFLNTNGYYDQLLSMMDYMVSEGFLPAAQREELIVESDPRDLIQKILQSADSVHPPAVNAGTGKN